MAGLQGNYLSVLIFLIGLVVGLILTSVVTNYSESSTGIARVGLLRTKAGQDILEFIRKYNRTRQPMSHAEVDKLDKATGEKAPVTFGDEKFHNDDDAVAQTLYNKVRVMCWIMTAGNNHRTKAIHVKATWGKRCNKLIFMSDAEDPELPAIKLNVQTGREHLTAKTMQSFDLAFHKDLHNFDWFMKADDDTYVILENMRYMLSDQNPDEPIYFGHHFKTIVKQGYFSGGGGYVISREALKRFGNRQKFDCAADHGAEDVEFGRCMEKLGVKTGDSRDAMGRSRFHCFNPATHIHGGYPDWYYQYDKYGGRKGRASMSDYAVSFHYVDVQEMYNLEYFVYHLRPYGIASGHQHLNIENKKRAS